MKLSEWLDEKETGDPDVSQKIGSTAVLFDAIRRPGA
jgi:hypothetical protein